MNLRTERVCSLSSTHKIVFFGLMVFFNFSFQRRCDIRQHHGRACPLGVGGERIKKRYGRLRLERNRSCTRSATARILTRPFEFKSSVEGPGSHRLLTAMLAQSTEMRAMCKRGRSSEVLLTFLRKFHRKPVECCHCCVYA